MHDVFLSSQSIKENRMDKFPKIVIATDKFKGTLNASEAADAIKNGILKRGLDSRCDIENLKRNITTFAMADGGEG
jgi:glycerate kinase